MRRLTSAILALSLAAAAACGSDDQRPSFDNPSQPITVPAGSEFDLALKSNQSTGYHWVLVDSAALGPLQLVSKDYSVPREYRDNNGAGGTERWTFRAPSAGSGVIALAYQPPHESEPAIDSVRFSVTVQ